MPDNLESTVAADQVAAHAADPHSHHGPIHTHCENCGTELKGPFCHACGQHDFEFHRSFGHVFLEALENFFHFDEKFFRNIVTLLFRPGRLTADFNAGKRASQMPPFRLYLFTAFVFFLLIFSKTGMEEQALNVSSGPPPKNGFTVNGQPVPAAEIPDRLLHPDATRPVPAAEKRNVDKFRELAEQLEQEARKKTPAEQANHPNIRIVPVDKAEKDKSDFERFLEHQGRRALEPEFRKEMTHAFLAALPKMLLFCLPFFALYTRVLFRKSGQVYLQHLVGAIHYHTFIYLWVMFRDGWVFLGNYAHVGGWISITANLWLAIYPLLMLRRLYGNSWKRTFFKTLALACAYACTLGVAFFLTAIALFLLL